MRALLIASFLLLACGKEEEIKSRVAAVQQQADERATKAKEEAQQKLDELQQQLEQLKTEQADTKAKLEDCANKTQLTAATPCKANEAALTAARQALKEEGHLEYANVNRAMTELGPKTVKAPSKAKAAFQKALQPVSAQQKLIAADLAAYDTATVDTFKTVKAKFQHDLANLKNALRAAKAALPPPP
jgi:chromosome segregation ATPase